MKTNGYKGVNKNDGGFENIVISDLMDNCLGHFGDMVGKGEFSLQR